MKRPPTKALLPLAVLAAGGLVAVLFVVTAPNLEVEPPPSFAPLVRVIEVAPETVRLTVSTQGTIAPRTESELVPEVSGRIQWVSPALVSGGFFKADAVLARVDPLDYELALERARATLARATSEHRRAQKQLRRRRGLQKSDAVSASRLDDAVNAEQVARAVLREATAAVAQAVRDLERTELRAPYAGRVRSESVDIGQFVNRGTPIARIYAIDYAEVRLPIPDEELAFLDLPLWRADETEVEGPEVVLRARFAGADHEWRGRVVRTEGEIDPQTRMVHVIARIKDPYAASDDGRPPLAVGLFVRAEIQGRMASNVVVVPRTALRNRDQIFLVDGEDRLRVRTADILRTDRNRAFLRGGLQPADRLVVSVLEPAVDGMRVRPVAAADPGETRRAEAVAEAARTPAVGAVPEAVE